MKRMAGTVSTISKSLMDDKREGELEDIITFRDASMYVAKEGLDKVANASYKAKHGGLRMDKINASDPEQCIEREVEKLCQISKLSCTLTHDPYGMAS